MDPPTLGPPRLQREIPHRQTRASREQQRAATTAAAGIRTQRETESEDEFPVLVIDETLSPPDLSPQIMITIDEGKKNNKILTQSWQS